VDLCARPPGGAWARGAGIDWVELPQSGVVRRLRGRDGWAGRRDGFMAQPPAEVTALQAVPGVEPGTIPTARALRLPDDRCLHRQAGGRSRGLDTLDSFLTLRGEPYRRHVLARDGRAGLFAAVAASGGGSLSLREVAQATAARQAERPGGRWGGSLTSFQSRLAWRDHFMQKLEDQPSIETRCLHPATEGPAPARAGCAGWRPGRGARRGCPLSMPACGIWRRRDG
jgi:deoxyribodipyrimidine photo-lyase